MLILFEATGFLLKALTGAPLPGPLMGMLLLAFWLAIDRKKQHPALEKTADGLLRLFALFFVPAGVGVLANLDVLRTAWLPISLGLVGSTLTTLTVTASLMQRTQRSFKRRGRL